MISYNFSGVRAIRSDRANPLRGTSSRSSEDPRRVHELVKLNQLCRHGFCRIDLLLIEDEIIMPFHLVAVGYLALGDLVSLFAEKLVGDGSLALLVQHSKADQGIEI